MEDIVALVAVTIPFIFVITLVWLVMHYKERRRRERDVKYATNTSTTELLVLAERMEHRIEALEQILDAEAPGWRKRHHEHS